MDDEKTETETKTETEKETEPETKTETFGGKGRTAIIIFFIIGVIIMVGYFYLLKISNTKGNKNVKSLISMVPMNNSNFWKLSHLVLFFFLGLFFPRSDFVVLGIGIIWELIEHNLGLVMPKVKREVNGKTEYIQWWSGKPSDIIIDFIGYYIGKAVYFQFNDIKEVEIWEVGFQ